METHQLKCSENCTCIGDVTLALSCKKTYLVQNPHPVSLESATLNNASHGGVSHVPSLSYYPYVTSGECSQCYPASHDTCLLFTDLELCFWRPSDDDHSLASIWTLSWCNL